MFSESNDKGKPLGGGLRHNLSPIFHSAFSFILYRNLTTHEVKKTCNHHILITSTYSHPFCCTPKSLFWSGQGILYLESPVNLSKPEAPTVSRICSKSFKLTTTKLINNKSTVGMTHLPDCLSFGKYYIWILLFALWYSVCTSTDFRAVLTILILTAFGLSAPILVALKHLHPALASIRTVIIFIKYQIIIKCCINNTF